MGRGGRGGGGNLCDGMAHNLVLRGRRCVIGDVWAGAKPAELERQVVVREGRGRRVSRRGGDAFDIV